MAIVWWWQGHLCLMRGDSLVSSLRHSVWTPEQTAQFAEACDGLENCKVVHCVWKPL